MNPTLLRLFILLARFFRRFVLPVTPGFVIAAVARLIFSKSGKRLEQATADPAEAQRNVLLDIVRNNARTVFGEEHELARVADVDDYRRRVPIRTYDELAPYIQRMADGEWRILTMEAPTFFGRTSGTTGAAKLIPITGAFREEYRRSRRIWYRQIAQTFPGLVRGAILTVHSPKVEGHTAGGIPYGSVTVGLGWREGRRAELPPELEQFPMDIHQLGDFETRYYTLLRHALSLPIALIGAVNPSTVMLLCRKLDEHAERLAEDAERGTLRADLQLPAELRARLEARYRPDRAMAKRIRASRQKHGVVRPIDLWPRLCGVLCWKGGPVGFYLKDFPRWFGDRKVMCYGYVASEGSFSVPLDADSDDGVLAVMGHFLEFVPEEAWERGERDTRLAHELELGKRYRVIITAGNGLYRYDINDVIEVTGFYQKTPKIRFCYKTGTVTSITGEKLTEHQVGVAFNAGAAAAGVELTGFTAALRLGEPPRYVFAVEPKRLDDNVDLPRLRAAIEHALREANAEYPSKRDSQRLGDPDLVIVPPGAFDAERARRVAEGSPDAHVKIPYLQPDEQLIERLGAARRT